MVSTNRPVRLLLLMPLLLLQHPQLLLQHPQLLLLLQQLLLLLQDQQLWLLLMLLVLLRPAGEGVGGVIVARSRGTAQGGGTTQG